MVELLASGVVLISLGCLLVPPPALVAAGSCLTFMAEASLLFTVLKVIAAVAVLALLLILLLPILGGLSAMIRKLTRR